MFDILAIDADWDTVTQYGHAFRKHFVFTNFARDWPAYKIHYIVGQDAVQPNIDTFINSNNIKYLTGMGHGLYDTFTGFKDSPVWDSNQNLTHLKEIIVHLLSCQTGALLGRSMVKQGVRGFWGYTVNFGFYRKATPPANLTEDSSAEIFLRMDCIIDRGILSNKNATEIYDSITDYVAKVYPKLKNKPLHQALLLDNYVHLVCPATTWGDPNVTL
jgi:hypothetical protein